MFYLSLIANIVLLLLLFSPNFAQWLHKIPKVQDAIPTKKEEVKPALTPFQQETFDALLAAINGWRIRRFSQDSMFDSVIIDSDEQGRYIHLFYNYKSSHKIDAHFYVKNTEVIDIDFIGEDARSIQDILVERIEQEKIRLINSFAHGA